MTERNIIITVVIVVFFIFAVQIAMIVLKLLNIVHFEWIWVMSVTWGSFIFWFLLAAGIILLDKLWGDKKNVS